MKSDKFQILLTTAKILAEFGENIKLARLRRKISAEQVAERANISRPTLLSIEKGVPGVAFGSYAQVLFVLNLEKDLEELWRRIVFSIYIKNTEDHLRNHGFLLTNKGWLLSPA